ncbi:hypothetical protein H312_02814 [Anncaliia algerae PRA339]|uniref:Uncharacterized protein n=1 Tax=Anncaliia algerae PRA339 TaxID=1288291 RepID=A0A059EY42_9MICR|nr:hypothetical protein H312_02814 [Anncaliia algerae PRA339]
MLKNFSNPIHMFILTYLLSVYLSDEKQENSYIGHVKRLREVYENLEKQNNQGIIVSDSKSQRSLNIKKPLFSQDNIREESFAGELKVEESFSNQSQSKEDETTTSDCLKAEMDGVNLNNDTEDDELLEIIIGN